jgi:hypothetical protein
MAKKKSGGKVEKVMHEYKEGSLKSGGKKKVKSRKQAVAIALSEAREAGEKVTPRKTAASKKASSKKSASRKSTSKKSASKKSSGGKSSGRKSSR